jgi:hypothetical protein
MFYGDNAQTPTLREKKFGTVDVGTHTSFILIVILLEEAFKYGNGGKF